MPADVVSQGDGGGGAAFVAGGGEDPRGGNPSGWVCVCAVSELGLAPQAGPEVGYSPVEDGHPLLLLGPASAANSGPLVASALGPQGVTPHRTGPIHQGKYITMWLPRGCTTPALGFPVLHSEVRRRDWIHLRVLRKVPKPPPLSRFFAKVLAMDRRGGDEGRNKRWMDGYGEECRGDDPR
jgi:hypothetical protein